MLAERRREEGRMGGPGELAVMARRASLGSRYRCDDVSSSD